METLDKQIDDLIDRVIGSSEDAENECVCCVNKNSNNANILNMLNSPMLNDTELYFNDANNANTLIQNNKNSTNENLLKIVSELNNLETLFTNTKLELQNYDNTNTMNNNFQSLNQSNNYCIQNSNNYTSLFDGCNSSIPYYNMNNNFMYNMGGMFNIDNLFEV